MKKDLGAVPGVFPMPVLMIATYDKNGKVDVMNAAWGMISDMAQITLFLSEDHKTTANIKESKAFTVSLADKDHIKEADYFGIASGNKIDDKFERTSLHATKSTFVNAPVIEEFPFTMECELKSIIDTDGFYAIVGTIKNSKCEESALDEKGKVIPEKLNSVLFDQFKSGYYTIGEKIGRAWNEGASLLKGK